MQNIAKTEARGDTEYEMCFGKASARAYVLWQVNTVCSMNLYIIFIIYMVLDGDSRWRERERDDYTYIYGCKSNYKVRNKVRDHTRSIPPFHTSVPYLFEGSVPYL